MNVHTLTWLSSTVPGLETGSWPWVLLWQRFLGQCPQRWSVEIYHRAPVSLVWPPGMPSPLSVGPKRAFQWMNRFTPKWNFSGNVLIHSISKLFKWRSSVTAVIPARLVLLSCQWAHFLWRRPSPQMGDDTAESPSPVRPAPHWKGPQEPQPVNKSQPAALQSQGSPGTAWTP